MMKLDHEGLALLLQLYPKTALSRLFGVSLPTLRAYCKGTEPQSIAVVENINREIRKLLGKKRTEVEHQHAEWRKP
jgi:hypothetical protein